MMLSNGYSNLEVKPSEISVYTTAFSGKLSTVMTHSDDLKEKDQATAVAAPVPPPLPAPREVGGREALSRRASEIGSCAAAASTFEPCSAPHPFVARSDHASTRPADVASPRHYRWQIGNSLSILHRLTGVALAFGLFALCYWLVSLAGGEQSYAEAAKLFASPAGLIGLFGMDLRFLYHLLNGVRHLFWDAGLRLRAHAAARERLVRGARLDCSDIVHMGLDMAGHRS